MKDADRPQLSGAVIVKDELDRIEGCIRSLEFCDEIVVVDTGSTDGTLDLLRSMNVELSQREFKDFAQARETARKAASGVWILHLDADERITPDLALEIRAAIETKGPTVGYRIGFRNYYRSQWLKHGGYYPDFRLRLFRRDAGRWDDRPVHEKVVLDGGSEDLSGHIDHLAFDSIPDCLDKAQWYAEMGAQIMFRNGRRAGAWAVAGHTAARFVQAYVIKRGFLAGGLGFVLAGVQAYETFQKYARLWELGRAASDSP